MLMSMWLDKSRTRNGSNLLPTILMYYGKLDETSKDVNRMNPPRAATHPQSP